MAIGPTSVEKSLPTSVGTTVPAQISLQPVAAPSILGLFGFAGATFMAAAQIAGWFGTAESPMFLFPFAAFFGGLAQFMAGMWAYRSRDGLATAVHGTWGAFWMAYGLLYLLGAAGVLGIPAGALFPELGFWFVVLAVTTWAATWASFAENVALTLVLGFLAFGSTLGAIGFIGGVDSVVRGAGWALILSAIIAWYTATALMLQSSFGREVLPLGKFVHAEEKPCVSVGICEPGVMHGQ